MFGKAVFYFSNVWKNRSPNAEQPLLHQSAVPSIHSQKSGVALIVVMWILVVVSLIISSFAFEMKLEAQIISMQRKRFKADQLALSGVELAKAMFAFQEDETEGDDVIYEDPWLEKSSQIKEGVPVTYEEELGGGIMRIHIDFEKGARNIRKMNNDQWHELFEQTGVPSVDRDELLGCLKDWQDEDDLHEINGAESDDFFYEDRGYECKNAPLDTIDELLLIKGWTEEIVYGTPTNEIDETEFPMTGIAQHFTTWGDGRVNPNSATEETLYSLYIDEATIEAVMEMRMGPDGEPNTEDDGLTREDFDALGLDPKVFTLMPEFVKLTVEGEVGGLISRIYSVFKLGDKEPTPLFWLEGMEEE